MSDPTKKILSDQPKGKKGGPPAANFLEFGVKGSEVIMTLYVYSRAVGWIAFDEDQMDLLIRYAEEFRSRLPSRP